MNEWNYKIYIIVTYPWPTEGHIDPKHGLYASAMDVRSGNLYDIQNSNKINS